MKGYLSIGKVSKIKNVSIKSLRYYDRIGVFSPAYINEATNYRYYTEGQLYLLDAILLCIELGIPLSKFDTYREKDGTVNMQRLLFDAKDLAEQKIHSMQNAISRLQATLNRLEEGGEAMEEIPAPPAPKKTAKKAKAAAKAENATDKKADKKEEAAPAKEPEKKAETGTVLEERRVVIAPFDEVTTAERYNHMLLTLFVDAQKNGYSAGYPTGLLYESKGGNLEKYVFATLTGETDGANAPDGEDFRVLPKASYLTARDNVHRIEKAEEVFGEAIEKAGGEYLLIETDVLEEKGVKELQLLVSGQ